MTAQDIQALFSDPTMSEQLKQALLSGAQNATGQTGKNASNQVQGSAQAGTFDSTGVSQQQSTQQQSQQQTGTQVGQTQQTQTGQTGVVDTLGTGAMLQGQQGAAQQAAGATSNFLSGVIQQGDPNLQSQVQQAVNNAMSGPGMVGAGQSANARAAGYAAADVARNAQAQQLQAAQQLSGPTAVTTLADASAPYLGQTSTGTTTGLDQQTTNTSSLGTTLANAIENQTQSGTSTGSSTQVAAGTSPTQQQKSGKVVCTVMVERGWLDREVVAAEVKYFQANWKAFERAAIGYLFFGQRLACWCLTSVLVSYLCWPFVWACTYETTRRLGWKRRFSIRAWLGYTVFYHFTDKLGFLLLRLWPSKAQSKVTDPVLVKLVQKHNLEV